jgi:hypothetical protein
VIGSFGGLVFNVNDLANKLDKYEFVNSFL